MSIMNLLFNLNAYADKKPSNNPSLSNFKWNRDIVGITANNPVSQTVSVASNSSLSLFTGASKKFLYLETNIALNVTINGAATPILVEPFVINNSTQAGILVLNSTITSLAFANPSLTDTANIFLAYIE